MARVIQTLFRFAAFALEVLIAVSAMPDQAFATSPSHNVVIEFDPDTGFLTVRDRVSGSSDAITLDRADWLEVDELRIGGELVGVPVGPTLVSPGLLNGQALEISLHGRISNTPSVTSRFGEIPRVPGCDRGDSRLARRGRDRSENSASKYRANHKSLRRQETAL
jgi:hypothetical protein